MSTTLLSFLGTGSPDPTSPAGTKRYRTAEYRLDGTPLGTSSFAAAVLADQLEANNILLVGTVKSLWDEAYRIFAERAGRAVNEDVQLGLMEQIDGIEAGHTVAPEALDLSAFDGLLGPHGQVIVLPYGLHRAELDAIFERLAAALEQLPETNRIYLDITHAFRSLPLYSLAALEYLTRIRGRGRLVGVYYAMLEAGRELGHTPVVALHSVLELHQWIRAGHALQRFGNGYELADLLHPRYPKIAARLRQLTDALQFNNLYHLEKLVQMGLPPLPDAGRALGVRIARRALEGFYGQFKQARGRADLQLRVAWYHYKRQAYGMAYLVLAEALVSYACKVNGQDPTDYYRRKEGKRWLTKSAHEDLYQKINIRRNRVAHQLDSGADPADDSATLKALLDDATTIIQQY